MRRSFLPVLITCFAIFANAADQISWTTNLKGAFTKAQAQNRLVVIDFWTEWCGWCKKLDSDTYTAPKVVEALSKMEAVKLDAEKEGKDAAKTYKVDGYPTILFLNGKGEVFGKIGGYLAPAAFTAEVKKAEARFKTYPATLKKLASDASDPGANAEMAELMSARGSLDAAEKHLKVALDKDPANKCKKLAQALNAVGDLYQQDMKFDQAIVKFEKAAELGKTADEIVYARLSVAACQLALGKPDKAISAAKLALNTRGISKEDQDMANQLIATAKASQKGTAK